MTVAHTKGLGLGKGTRPFYGVLSSAHMTTTDALRAALAGDGDARTLTLDRGFQGLPDMAHGGSVLAAFDAVAGRRGPRTLRGHYLKRVPLGAPLALRVAGADGGARFTLAEGATTLVQGSIEDAPPRPDEAIEAPAADAMALPISRGCFACGSDNPLGLAVQLRADETAVGAILDRIGRIVSEGGGTVGKVDRWGRRRLAYQIARQSEGYYAVVEFTADPSVIVEVERSLQLADEVLRFKVVQKAA